MSQQLYMSLKKLITSVSLSLLLVLILPGCSTLLLRGNFPQPPAVLMAKPSEFKKLDETKKLELSDIVDNSKFNFATGFEIKTQLELLQEWVRSETKNYK